MRTHNFIFGLSLVGILMLNAGRGIADDQQAKSIEITMPVKMDYLISLPENYDSQDSWPLMLFLHGAGERGNDVQQVAKHGPPKLIKEGQNLPFIIVSPQCPRDEWWATKTVELTALLDEIIKTHKVDEDRVYLTGLSMGGFGTWALAVKTPDRFAAIAPVCGGGDRQFARIIKDLPVWIFHGAKDSVVPLERSTEMADALKAVNADVKLTVYPEATHDSWTETYANPKLYDWFLSHTRKSGAAQE